jgi:hypothetical protein
VIVTDVNHQDIVAREHARQAPDKTVDGALAFTVRVLAALPRAEGAGLLRKPAGENIAAFHGVLVSAGRVCYADGKIYKILTDIPATMAPVWNDDGVVEVTRYFDVAAFLDPQPPPAPELQPTPRPTPAPGTSDDPIGDELDKLLDAGARIVEALGDVRNVVIELGSKVDALNANADHFRKNGVAVHLGR